MRKNEYIELLTYQLLKKGLFVLIVLELLIFLVYGFRFFGYILKSSLFISFIIINIILISGLYFYFSYKEKKIKERIKKIK